MTNTNNPGACGTRAELRQKFRESGSGDPDGTIPMPTAKLAQDQAAGWRTLPEELEDRAERARAVHAAATRAWDWNRLSVALASYWDLALDEEGTIEPEEREVASKAITDAVATIAAYVYPGDPATFDDDVLAEKVYASECLHEIADALADQQLHALADAVCSPAIHAFNGFVAEYLAYAPFGPRSEVSTAALREAAKAVLKAEARTELELALKARLVCLIGVHARLKRRFPLPAAEAGAAYGAARAHLDRLPNWVVGGALCRRMRPQWINDLDPPPNRDEKLILDAIRDAGPAAEASLAADVEHIERGPPAA